MTSLPVIELRSNGPLLVKGLETLRDTGGRSIPTEQVIALCRCCGSGKKPFWNGTHHGTRFTDEQN